MNFLTCWIVVVVALMAGGCRSQIQHGLDEREANEIVSTLSASGFDARKVLEKGKKPTWAIELDDRCATDALRLLSELKLPRPPRTTTREVTSQVGLVETPSAERLRQLEALEGDLEQMLEAIDGVASASVELVVPTAPRAGQVPVSSKASVLLRVHPETFERIAHQREATRALIAGSVEGLKSDEVVVMLDAVTRPSSPFIAEPTQNRFSKIIAAMGVGLAALATALVAMVLRLRRVIALSNPKTAEVARAAVTSIKRASNTGQRLGVDPGVQRRAG